MISLSGQCCSCEVLDVQIKSKFSIDTEKCLYSRKNCPHFKNKQVSQKKFSSYKKRWKNSRWYIEYMQNLQLPHLTIQQNFLSPLVPVNELLWTYTIWNITGVAFYLNNEGRAGNSPNGAWKFILNYVKRIWRLLNIFTCFPTAAEAPTKMSFFSD